MIVAEGASKHCLLVLGSQDRRGDVIRGGLNEICCACIISEQRFDLMTKLFISTTGLIKKGQALGRRSFQIDQASFPSVLLQPPKQPSLGHAPITSHGLSGNLEDLCSFLLGHSSKVAKLHYAALPWRKLGQIVERIVERHQLGRSLRRDHSSLIK